MLEDEEIIALPMNADFDDEVLPMRVVVFGEVLKKRNILLSSVF